MNERNKHRDRIPVRFLHTLQRRFVAVECFRADGLFQR